MTNDTLPASMKEEREAFEAFIRATRTGHGIKHVEKLLVRDEYDCYAQDHTQRHWWTWQQSALAARAGMAPAKPVSEPTAYLVTNLRSGEPSLCFPDERGDYGDEDFAPVFEPLVRAVAALQDGEAL